MNTRWRGLLSTFPLIEMGKLERLNIVTQETVLVFSTQNLSCLYKPFLATFHSLPAGAGFKPFNLGSFVDCSTNYATATGHFFAKK